MNKQLAIEVTKQLDFVHDAQAIGVYAYDYVYAYLNTRGTLLQVARELQEELRDQYGDDNIVIGMRDTTEPGLLIDYLCNYTIH